ncbi:conserved hypothetical protein [Candidatus Zixiibacteriota bacterium]|nr:conserved hypothetical protein [candidate division Zixibacteria bacterium]
MKPIKLNDVVLYVEDHIGGFHKKRLESLQGLKLIRVIARKNPYLYRAKNILTSQDLVKSLLDAHLSSQEESIFGEFLENLAIFVCSEVYDGRKSTTEGIDMEFDKDGRRYIVTIKSGPNWGNSGQIAKMRDYFKKAKKILRTNAPKMDVIAVNGCCYGRDRHPDKEDYFKYCGAKFWEFISGNNDLYLEIIEPLGHKAKEKNEAFQKEYSRLINLFTLEFSKKFCIDGEINWGSLVKFNSSPD